MIEARKYSVCAFGLFVIAAFVAYHNTINSFFLSDDFAQIGKVLRGDLSLSWGQAHGGFFRPLFIISYLLDTKIWGARPLGFHLTNVTLHALNAFLAFILSVQLVRNLSLSAGMKRQVPLASGFLFLLHPSHAEAVTWISGRADVIATFFCLASLVWYVAYTRSTRRSYLLLSLACFSLALLAKESAICLPLFILIVGHASSDSNGKGFKQVLKVTVLFLLVLLVWVLVRRGFIGSFVGGYGAGQHLNFSPSWLRDRMVQASLRSVLPALPSEWSAILLKPLQSRLFILISLICDGLILTAIIFRRRWYGAFQRKEQNRFLGVVLLLFLSSLLPVINLRLSLYQTQGERFVYLPSIFSSLIICYLSAILIRNTGAWFLFLLCILTFYSAKLYQTNKLWREAAELSHTIKDDLANSSSRDRLFILNAPDNLKGVPVYHNGLADAVRYFQSKKQIEQIQINSFHNVQSATDEVQLVGDSNSLTLNLLNQDDTFVLVVGSEYSEILGHSRSSLRLRFTQCSADADVFFFDKGRMVKLPDNHSGVSSK